jgi:hypothetical protein
MRTAFRVAITIGIICFALTVWSYAAPEWLCVILSFVALASLALTLPISASFGLMRWKKSPRLWILPALVCAAFLATSWWLAPPLGRFLGDLRFRKHLSEYQNVVNEVHGDEGFAPPSVGAGWTIYEPRQRPIYVKAVEVGRCDDGSVVIAFLSDTDAPLLHEGYVYEGFGNGCESADVSPEKRWPYVRPVIQNWYHFSDQPGL